MMKYTLLIISLLFCLQLDSFAQTNFIEDFEVSRMMDQFTQNNKSKNLVSGWRIQLIATTDRRKMEDVQREFMSKYPEIRVDWEHKKPYYKLKAGAFASKNDALPTLYKIKPDYPSAFPAKVNNINPRELVGL